MEVEAQQTKKVSRFAAFALAACFAISTIATLALPLAAQAQTASLYLAPSTGTYQVGQTFSVGIRVSANQAMNAASGTLGFPTGLLQVTGVSKSGSIINLWVQEPTFSNATGTVDFEGIVFNPGYTGTSGTILNVTFKAISAGTAKLSITQGSVLANDGNGTNMAASLGTASFTLVAATVPETPPPTAPPEAMIGAPTITSSTHPDQTKWYALRHVALAWLVPDTATGVSVSLDHDEGGDPGDSSDGLFSKKEYDGVADGVWYFHAKLLNTQGWGPFGTYRLNIDATPPDQLAIHTLDGTDRPDHRPSVWITVREVTSGVDYIEVTPQGGLTKKVELANISEDNPFVFVPTAPGEQTVHIKVVDLAGNFVEGDGTFTTVGTIPPLLEQPGDLVEGDDIHTFGETYANAQVNVTLTDPHGRTETRTTTSKENGTFDILWPHSAQAGTYSMFATVVGPNGVTSDPSETITFEVERGLEYELAQLSESYTELLLGSLIVFLVIMLALLFISLRFIAFRHRLDNLLHEVKHEVEHQFGKLKKVKGHLTKDEEEAQHGITQSVDHAIRVVHQGKKIHDDKKPKKK